MTYDSYMSLLDQVDRMFDAVARAVQSDREYIRSIREASVEQRADSLVDNHAAWLPQPELVVVVTRIRDKWKGVA